MVLTTHTLLAPKLKEREELNLLSGPSWSVLGQILTIGTASYTRGTGSFPGVKWPGTHPYLAPRLKEEHSYTSAPLWAFVAYSRVTFAFTFIVPI